MNKIVFIIQLINNKFYIGSTYDIFLTLKQIFNKKPLTDYWLRTYKPLYVHKVVHNCKSEDEYKYLMKYIKEFGNDNIRGPTYDSFKHKK